MRTGLRAPQSNAFALLEKELERDRLSWQDWVVVLGIEELPKELWGMLSDVINDVNPVLTIGEYISE